VAGIHVLFEFSYVATYSTHFPRLNFSLVSTLLKCFIKFRDPKLSKILTEYTAKCI